MSPEVIQYSLTTAQQGMQSLLAYDQRTLATHLTPALYLYSRGRTAPPDVYALSRPTNTQTRAPVKGNHWPAAGCAHRYRGYNSSCCCRSLSTSSETISMVMLVPINYGLTSLDWTLCFYFVLKYLLFSKVANILWEIFQRVADTLWQPVQIY